MYWSPLQQQQHSSSSSSLASLSQYHNRKHSLGWSFSFSSPSSSSSIKIFPWLNCYSTVNYLSSNSGSGNGGDGDRLLNGRRLRWPQWLWSWSTGSRSTPTTTTSTSSSVLTTSSINPNNQTTPTTTTTSTKLVYFFPFWRSSLLSSSSSLFATLQQQYRQHLPHYIVRKTAIMLPHFTFVTLDTWHTQVPAFVALLTILWLALKLWRSIRERQIRFIPATWNGIHAHQWSLIQCLTHRATCCVCRSLIVDAMLCDSCGVCLDFACYQLYINRFGASVMNRLKRVKNNNNDTGIVSSSSSPSTTTTKTTGAINSGEEKIFETLGQCKTVSIPKSSVSSTFTSPTSSTFFWPHQWIHGNLPSHSRCFICEQYCDDDDNDGDDDGDDYDDILHYPYEHIHCPPPPPPSSTIKKRRSLLSKTSKSSISSTTTTTSTLSPSTTTTTTKSKSSSLSLSPPPLPSPTSPSSAASSLLVGDHTLYHYRCCWCQRTVHESCFAKHYHTLTATAINSDGGSGSSSSSMEDNIITGGDHINAKINAKQTFSGGGRGCDFGHWRRYILPPPCIIHRRVWSSKSIRGRGRSLALDTVQDFRQQCPQWEPLFVVANRKSGNNDAGSVLSRFHAVLNPLQVIDLAQSDGQTSLELALQICQLLPPGVQARMLVAGGDGTIGWVLNTVEKVIKSDHQPLPAVAILPLGTGNDLARVLGWTDVSASFDELTSSSGSGINIAATTTTGTGGDDTGVIPPPRDNLLKSIYDATPIRLDRWSVDIKPSGYLNRSRSLLIASLHIPKSVLPSGNRTVSMYNYFSVGVDALVALNFHQTRKSNLYKFLFSNTLINKFLYFTYGTKDLLERRCANLHTKVHLELDGKPVTLPELESIVLLNIPSWGGGVRLNVPSTTTTTSASTESMMTTTMTTPPVLDDQLIEVFGLCSTFHIGQVMVGLSKPIFLGQAKHIRLCLNEHLPVQVDGEPWLQSPAVIELQWHSHAVVLSLNHDQQSPLPPPPQQQSQESNSSQGRGGSKRTSNRRRNVSGGGGGGRMSKSLTSTTTE